MSESVATLEQETPVVAQETRAETPADAAPPPESQEVEASPSIEEIDAGFAGFVEDGKESPEPAPEPIQSNREAVSREAEARRQQFGKKYGERQAGLDEGFASDTAGLDGLRQVLLDRGFSAAEADWALRPVRDNLTRSHKRSKDILNEHHADSLGSAGYESARIIQAAEQAQVLAAGKKFLSAPAFTEFNQKHVPEINQAEQPTAAAVEALMQLAVTEGRKGYVSTKGVPSNLLAFMQKNGLLATFVQVRAQTEKVANGTRSKPLGVNGNAPSASNEPKNLAEAEQMHAGMHPSGRTITNAQMLAYTARFNKGNQ